MTRRAWTYIIAVLVVGGGITVQSLLNRHVTRADWTAFLVLTALATLAQLFKAEAPKHVLFYASPVFFFAGVLLLPPAPLVLLVIVPHLVEWVRERLAASRHLRAWYLQPFNMAMYVIACTAADAVNDVAHAHTLHSQQAADFAGAMAAAVVFVAVNHLLLGQALVLARSIKWRESGVFALESVLSDVVLVCLGSAVALLWPINPWFSVPALAPLVLIYQALTIPQLKQDAQTDAKTGLLNARHFDTLFSAELGRAQRFERPLAVVMADLDFLRDINNTYGHLAGDIVLSGIGQIIRTIIRDYDVAARFGGEEFSLVLPEVTLDQAQGLAERLRATVEEAKFTVPTSPDPIHVTMSLGVALFPDDATSARQLIHAADVAVYQAKANGRNRVVCAADIPSALLADDASQPHMYDASIDAHAGGADGSRAAPAATGGGSSPEQRAAVRGLAESVSDVVTVGAGNAQGLEHRDRHATGNGMTGPVWLFLGGVVAAALLAVGLQLLTAPTVSTLPLLLLMGLGIVAELLQVDLYGRGTVSVSMALVFAAAVLGGIPGLACVSAAIAVVHHLRRGRRGSQLQRVVFNWAVHVLAGLPAALLVHRSGLRLDMATLPQLVPVAAVAAVAYVVIETGLISAILGMTEGIAMKTTWQEQFRWLAGHYVVLCLMGLVLGMVYTAVGAIGVLVFTLPVFMMHVVQKQYVRQTKESIRTLQRLNQELTAAALADHLTGLGNQRAFRHDLHREIARATRYGHRITVARMDIDEFKAINDRHGGSHGDRVLAGVGAVLRGGRAADRVFRLVGDEFAIVLPHTTMETAATVMERLREEVQTRLDGVTISVGLATLDLEHCDADLLVEQADAALQAAKQRGRDTVVQFPEVQQMAPLTSSTQAQAVRRLLEERRLTIAFQPIWDLDGGRILAYEALTRPCENYGLVGPEEAFTVAERLGHAQDLDVICQQAVFARAHELPRDALLFVNVSPHTLSHDLLSGTKLAETVMAAGLTPDHVVLEITERSLAHLPTLIQEAQRLRALGFKIALDDTGAGNAGLEMLSQLPVDFVKVDRGVVAGALHSRAARAVLAGIVAIAREMNTYVIAEGIETPALLDMVRQIGGEDGLPAQRVQGVQGYLLGMPDASIPHARTVNEHREILRAAANTCNTVVPPPAWAAMSALS